MTLNALSEFLEVNKENLTPDPFLTYDMSTPMKEEGDLNLNTTNSKSRTPLGDITPPSLVDSSPYQFDKMPNHNDTSAPDSIPFIADEDWFGPSAENYDKFIKKHQK